MSVNKLKGALTGLRFLLFIMLIFALLIPCRPGLASYPRSRPESEKGPTDVNIGIYVIDISRVDDANQRFSTDFILRLTWKDPRLAIESDEDTSLTRFLSLDEIWHPAIGIIQQENLTRHYRDNVEISPSGDVKYSQRYSGNVHFVMDLKDFPFDDHIITLSASSYPHDIHEVQLIPDPEITGIDPALTLTGWKILSSRYNSDTSYMAPQNKYRSRFNLEIEVKREPGFFLMRIVFPLSIIVFMSWMVFWINPIHLEAQIGVSATALLSLFAFHFSMGELLPRISYLTRMDIFVTGSTLLIFLAIVETVRTSLLADNGQEKRALDIDSFCRVFFPLLYISIAVYSMLVIF